MDRILANCGDTQKIIRHDLQWLIIRNLSLKSKGSSCVAKFYSISFLYRLTPVLIAPRVKLSGVKPRWLSHLSRFLTFLA